MSWDEHHSQSERLAAEAELAARSGMRSLADELYRKAAESEASAFDQVSSAKRRTRGITAVSAVALWYKGHELSQSERLAYRYLGTDDLQDFAQTQLRELLTLIWTTRSAELAGVHFVPGDVLVSVKGGDVVHGGAPLDLIVRKVEGVQAVLLRTVEMLLDRPFRRRGSPAIDIQSMFKPWLFQAPAGSYQFAVRVQEPTQRGLWDSERPRLDQVTQTFFRVLHASATDPEVQLPSVVPNKEYRDAFLNLSRNLAPTGKTFERLDVRDASNPGTVVASFAAETRQELNTVLRRAKRPMTTAETDTVEIVHGTLRALHLDQDWLEVTASDDLSRHVKIEQAGDALDDVVGPMVNRLVNVSVVRRGPKYIYRDIELEE